MCGCNFFTYGGCCRRSAVAIGAAARKKATVITPPPPPGHSQMVAENQSNVVVGMARGGKGKGGKKKAPKGGVTPEPPKGTATKAAAASKKPAAKPPSKTTLEAHKKWQAEAEKRGGPSARIIVSKKDAKKPVFDKLMDSFKPMNITDLHNANKAIIPSAVLRSTLDEMIDNKPSGNPFADDSNDGDDEPKKKKKSGAAKKSDESDPFAGSLSLKEGRNATTTLYYVDYTKQANNGNGLLPEDRNELHSNMAKSNAERDQLTQQHKQISAEAAQLESEPKNGELILEVGELETRMTELENKLEEASAYAGNEKRAQLVKKNIEVQAGIWRRRKRQCIEFISNLEESTDGTISLKKCLKGDGQIDIDSDEAAISGAIAFTSRKRPRMALSSKTNKGGLKSGGDASSGVSADPNLVGVKLTAQGKPERVFMGDEAQ